MNLFLARHGETVSNAVGRALGGGGRFSLDSQRSPPGGGDGKIACRDNI